MAKDIIAELAALDDAALMAKLGLTDTLAEFKTSLTEAAALDGDARKEVNASLERQLNPTLYPGDLKWKVQDAKRHAKMKAAKQDPSELTANCCGCLEAAPD